MGKGGPASLQSELFTKKEQILRLAQEDPFLRVEEIAAKAATTPRYVRTILSEAGISLMELRRNYARTMERRLGVHVPADKPDPGSTKPKNFADLKQSAKQVRVVRAVVPYLAEELGLHPDEPLLQVSRVRFDNDQPYYVNQVVTHKSLTVSEDMVTSEKPLRQLLGLEVEGETEFIDRRLEVEQADGYIAGSLGLHEGEPVIKSGNVIVTQGERVGVELNYFDAYRVRFLLDGPSEYILKIEERMTAG